MSVNPGKLLWSGISERLPGRRNGYAVTRRRGGVGQVKGDRTAFQAEVRQAGTWDPFLQYCSDCTCTNISLSNKIQRNYKGLKITACKFWTKRFKETKEPNCHF